MTNEDIVAAAPDLLEALRGMLEMVAPSDGGPDSRKSVRAARAAISKAEGRAE